MNKDHFYYHKKQTGDQKLECLILVYGKKVLKILTPPRKHVFPTDSQNINILCENDAKPKVNDIYQSAEKMMVGSITERCYRGPTDDFLLLLS